MSKTPFYGCRVPTHNRGVSGEFLSQIIGYNFE